MVPQLHPNPGGLTEQYREEVKARGHERWRYYV